MMTPMAQQLQRSVAHALCAPPAALWATAARAVAPNVLARLLSTSTSQQQQHQQLPGNGIDMPGGSRAYPPAYPPAPAVARRAPKGATLVGVPKEIKNNEFRVGLTPGSARELVRAGHGVLVQADAGTAIGFPDEAYRAAGATVVPSAADVFSAADVIVKVKEPQPEECRQLRPEQVLFTYLHLAPDPAQTRALIDSGAVAIAYETVTDTRGGLPLLAPMSEVAGRLSIQAGARALEMSQGGRGTLLGGVPGVAPAKVCIIGGGVVGTNAARMAHGLGADVAVLDRSVPRLKQLDDLFAGTLKTIFATADSIEEHVLAADLVVGAVLVPGAAAPKLVDRALVSRMQQGAVLVDVAIDQGGCFATSRPTTHQDPCYVVDGVVHYCVANMPGATARTSTQALNNATLGYALDIANKGWREAIRDDVHLRAGLNVWDGKVTCEAVARDQGIYHVPPEEAIADAPDVVAVA